MGRESGERFGWRMEGWSRGVCPIGGSGGGGGALWPKARKWVHEMAGETKLYLSSSPLFFFFFLSPRFSPLLLLLQLPSWWTPGLLILSLSFHSLFSHNLPADRRTGGHDGRCPLLVRQHFLSVPEARSGGIRGKPAAGLFQCLWGPITVFGHPSHDPRIGRAGLEQTGADHTALPSQNLHTGHGTTCNHAFNSVTLLSFSLSLGAKNRNTIPRA